MRPAGRMARRHFAFRGQSRRAEQQPITGRLEPRSEFNDEGGVGAMGSPVQNLHKLQLRSGSCFAVANFCYASVDHCLAQACVFRTVYLCYWGHILCAHRRV